MTNRNLAIGEGFKMLIPSQASVEEGVETISKESRAEMTTVRSA